MAISEGTQAPDFTLRTASDVGKSADDFGLSDVSLSEHKGKDNVVLLFVPGAFTGVCTKQLCNVSEDLSKYSSANGVVYAISCDTAFAQKAWAEKENITVPLLSDYDKKVVEKYDVVLPDLVGLGKGSKRAAFVIDKEGVVRYSEETPSPLELPDSAKILETLKGLS